MVETMKTCKICGKVISDLNDPGTDWFVHIKKIYCENCQPTAEKISGANRQKTYRARKREEAAQKDALLRNLLAENQELRKMIAEMRDENA